MTPAETVARALDRHRWKSMGVSSVECECGEVIHANDEEPLAQFPADEAFRHHVGAEAVAALGLTEEYGQIITGGPRQNQIVSRYVTNWQEVGE